ncbi:MAG: hypothetical protein H6615_07790 [Ignavibacteria bacterium]|nr:hypothetical protein [Ignavibacteria bacterium]
MKTYVIILTVVVLIFGLLIIQQIDLFKAQLAALRLENTINNPTQLIDKNIKYKSTDIEFFDSNNKPMIKIDDSGISMQNYENALQTYYTSTGILFANDSSVPYNVMLTGKGILFVKKDSNKLELLKHFKWGF